MKITTKDNQWQKDLYEKVKNLAGKRYTPEINVDLPIQLTFDGLARNEAFYIRIRKLFGELRKCRNHIFPNTNPDLLGIELLNFDYCFEELLSLIDQIKDYSTCKLPWKEIKANGKKIEDYGWKLQDRIYEVQKSPDNDKKDEHSEKIFNSELYYLSKFRNTLHELNELSASDATELSNHPFLLLMGVTGIGKTHLLCDLVKNRNESGAFSFITLGQEINTTGEIWKQIIKLNGDSRIKSKVEFLKKLNALGEKVKSRSFVIIDALNESESPSFWKKALPILINDIKSYPSIGLIISIRNGFEKEVITASVRKKFHEVEHVGFKFREWEAIKEFFTQFGLPLPEIPLINPEFSVPLFLLLFCKSRQKRAKKKSAKQLFRGHEGSTSIFEDFIKEVSESINKEFGIGSVGGVWIKLIKPLAEGMVNSRGSKDKISENQFKKLIAKELPNVDFGSLTSSLIKNYLLIRVPRYGKKGNKTGFDYRFTYQRFSDHLISRYLLNKYADKKVYGANAKNNLKKVLRKNGTIGRYFYNYSLQGLMNALSIQVPERLDGEELIDLCPWAEQLLEEPFLESIVWRDPKAFYLDTKASPKKTINIINRLIIPFDGGPSKFFSTILNVAGVPGHPFNALKLHAYLVKLGRKSRDQIWSTFLHYSYGENSSVDRLLHWVLSASFNKAISTQSKLLMGIILTWFLTTPNRSVRDKSTKGLVILLEDSPSVLFELNKLFVKVDDLYVLERLFAATYGVVLRLSDYKDPTLKGLGELFYENIFLSKKPYTHILVRDYAKCIIDVLVKEKAYFPPDLDKVSSVLVSKWPKKLPTIKTLEKKFEPKGFSWDKASYEDRGVQAIWNSFDGIADFFRYIVSPAISHWSTTKITEPSPPTLKVLQSDFEATLNRSQKRLYRQIQEVRPVINILSYLTEKNENQTEEEKQKIAEEKRLSKAIELIKKSFWYSLTNNQKAAYLKIQKHPRTHRGASFNPEIAKRWIIKRVFEMYSPSHHGHFDGVRATHYDHARDDHPAERIGKKYQWIALHELLGNLADNFRFLEKDYPPECGDYKGAWQIGVRDIDPTCITLYKPSFENSPWQPKYDAWKVKETNEKWIKRRADLPEPVTLTAYKDLKGVEWYILNSYFKWEQNIPPEEERYEYPSRDIFYMLYSYLIKEDGTDNFFRWFGRQNFYGRWMPEVRAGIQECFFREYPDSEIYEDIYSGYDTPPDGWITKVWGRAGRNKIPSGIMEVYDEFSITNASRDKSVEESFHIALPSKWLVKGMRIKHSNQDGFWINKRSQIICGDLSLNEGGNSVLAVKKIEFLKFLKRNKFSLVWTLVGEKGVFGLGRGNGKIQQISGAYLLKSDGTITGKFKLISEKNRH